MEEGRYTGIRSPQNREGEGERGREGERERGREGEGEKETTQYAVIQ
jgi:hypothetical protein